jgi:hypothetical protein
MSLEDLMSEVRYYVSGLGFFQTTKFSAEYIKIIGENVLTNEEVIAVQHIPESRSLKSLELAFNRLQSFCPVKLPEDFKAFSLKWGRTTFMWQIQRSLNWDDKAPVELANHWLKRRKKGDVLIPIMEVHPCGGIGLAVSSSNRDQGHIVYFDSEVTADEIFDGQSFLVDKTFTSFLLRLNQNDGVDLCRWNEEPTLMRMPRRVTKAEALVIAEEWKRK